MSTVDTTIHTCPSCDLRFVQLVELLSHLDTDHPHPPPPIPDASIGRLTVPLDPDRPLPVALDVARRLAAQAHLVVDLVASPGLASLAPTQAFLQARARLMRVRDGVEVTWHALPVELPAVAVNQHVVETDSDLLCLSTRARHGARHLLFGSVAEAILLGAEVPVLLVGPEVPSSGRDYRTVVACIDGSPEATSALQVADRLRKTIGADLELIDVLEPDAATLGENAEAAVLVRATRSLDQQPSNFEVLHDRHPAEAIARYVNERDDVIVVTGTHNRTGLRFVLRDSVARAVVGASRHPVLVVPPGARTERFLAPRDVAADV